MGAEPHAAALSRGLTQSILRGTTEAAGFRGHDMIAPNQDAGLGSETGHMHPVEGVSMSGFYTNLSIRSRFVLPIAGMVLAFAVFIMVFFPSRQRAVDQKGLENKGMSITRMIGYSVAAGLEFEDRESVLQVLNWARNDPDILYIVVRNAAGDEFATYGVEGQAPAAMASLPTDFQARESGEVLEVVGPVRRGEAITGSLQVGVSTRSIAENYRLGLWTALLFNLTVAALAFGTVFFVGRQITAPILSLT
ncbi:MAG: CHASE sensor domain-containing protein, partial [Vicinamibacteria bacterium]